MASVAAVLREELCSGYPRTERTSVLPNTCSSSASRWLPLLSIIRELEVSDEVISIAETLQLQTMAV